MISIMSVMAVKTAERKTKRATGIDMVHRGRANEPGLMNVGGKLPKECGVKSITARGSEYILKMLANV